jgi:hypothetical protein
MPIQALAIVAAVGSILAGCLFPSNDPGPLKVSLDSFRILSDRWHIEYRINFTNVGAEEITWLHAGRPTAEMENGANFTIDGDDYVFVFKSDVDSPDKGRVGLSTDAEGNPLERPPLLTREEPLQPNQSVSVTYWIWHDYWHGDEWSKIANDTDFYTFGFVAKYEVHGYEWNVVHELPCYNTLGHQVYHWADKVGGNLNCPDAIGPLHPPKWQRFSG